METRQLLAADAFGPTNLDTGEFFLGSVTVTPVFFESDGSGEDHTQSWTEQEIDEALAKIGESVQWWSNLLGTITDKHKLEFVIDDTYARDPVETSYEPIANTSQTFQRYVSDFLIDQDLGDSSSVNHGMLRFNDRQRNAPENQTDWAFTIFMVDSSDDSDGFFDRSGEFSGAFAYSGGLYVVTPSTRPTSTITHEIGHIFWARDEYPGGGTYTDRAGYYDSQNINAFDNPNLEQEPGIMRGGTRTEEAFQQGITSLRTLEFVGWRDSDGDGVFDLADVPLDLDVAGYFDAENSVYHVSGSASAVPLLNQNSRSFQSDITFNQIDRLEYRLDGGDWATAQTYDQQQVDIDVAIELPSDFDTIEFRVVDAFEMDSGQEAIITESSIVSGTALEPALNDWSLRGYVYLDSDDDGERSASDALLTGTTATLLAADGSNLFGGSITATAFDGAVPATVPGLTLTAVGAQYNEQVYASNAIDNADIKVFQARNFTFDRFEDGWGDSVALSAAFDQTVGEVNVSVVGLDSGSYARLEAYDSTGNLLTRTTSELIAADAMESISIEDPQGRIARVQVLGHARTKIAIVDLDFGFSSTVTTNADGVWQFPNLAAGDYQLQLAANNLIHQFDASTVNVQVTDQPGPIMAVAASVGDSPRHNVDLAFDVDGANGVTPADILAVINDIAENGARTLGQHETAGLNIDVSNDGMISPLDVLRVINYLAENASISGGLSELIDDSESAFSNEPASTDAFMAKRESPDSDFFNSPQAAKSLSDQHETALKDGVFSQMFNSAGNTTRDESTSSGSTDSQTDGVVFSESDDSDQSADGTKKPANDLRNDLLAPQLSAELADTGILSSAFEGNSLEPKR
ncbi:dockerin type I domain-containing protein [Planctomycetes bacterium K23_9]|uniref:dockerin type I domain-containing protein n=1 Tax=Stieleria marina TaxID=1930275 RepID=UPI0011A7E9CD